MNGKEQGGKYFLGSHGAYKEVTRAFFDYSRIHGISVWITHSLAMLCGLWIVLHRKPIPLKT